MLAHVFLTVLAIVMNDTAPNEPTTNDAKAASP
jgi:hypothetical protein